jgi:uncharacterized protein (DUF1778 family)
VSDVKAEAPIMMRVNITRDELRAIKATAALEGKTVQEFVADALREKMTS